MRVALTTDWIMRIGGAEQVIANMLRLFPDATVFTTVTAADLPRPLSDADIRVSGLQGLYRALGSHTVLFPWMPGVMESHDLTGSDIVLSSSHSVGKGVIPPPSSFHVCYCHTPMRYAWFMEEEYLRDYGIPTFVRPFARRFLDRMRAWDLATAHRVDLFIANSTSSAERIQRIYKRESIILPPPVGEQFYESHLGLPIHKRRAYLAVGRLVPYKRFDLLIDAANEARFALDIIGTGKEAKRLKRRAGPTVRFLDHVQDGDMPKYFAGAKALLAPQEEDAGVVLLEAQASGTPVIAYGKGGAVTLTTEGYSSILFKEQSARAMIDAVKEFETKSWDPASIRESTRAFSEASFRENLERIIESAYVSFKKGEFTRT